MPETCFPPLQGRACRIMWSQRRGRGPRVVFRLTWPACSQGSEPAQEWPGKCFREEPGQGYRQQGPGPAAILSDANAICMLEMLSSSFLLQALYDTFSLFGNILSCKAEASGLAL